jgi:hypothetical protein
LREQGAVSFLQVFGLVDTDDSGSMNFKEYLAFFGGDSSQRGGF